MTDFIKKAIIVFIIFVHGFLVYPLYAQQAFVQEVFEQTEKQQCRKAIERIDSAFNTNPESMGDSVRANLLYIKGYAYQNLIASDETALDSALTNYNLVVATGIYPINIGALNNLGYLYGDLGDYKRSIAYFTQILSIDPNSIGALNNIAYDKNQSGSYQEAIIYADKAYKAATDTRMKGVVLNNKAYSYLKLGNLNEALKLIDASLKLNPENSFAYYHRALVYIEQKKYDKVCVALNKAKELGGINLTSELIGKYCKKEK